MGNIVVQKFGGTSVGNTDKIQAVAQIIAAEYAKNPVIVVVSAMAGVTDQLVGYVNAISTVTSEAEWAEYDSVVASGEQVNVGLVALALRKIGIKARSFLGWQLPITTNGEHSKARITNINVEPLLACLAEGEIPVVAGFQGVYKGRVVTLGRGGSDTTAAAVAAAAQAHRCDIYTDVDGVFTADPRLVPHARQLFELTYAEMLEMAAAGAKVLHPRAAQIAMRYNLNLRILSVFKPNCQGTTLVKERKNMEINAMTISSRPNLTKITLWPQKPNSPALGAILAILEESKATPELLVEKGENIAIVREIHRRIINNSGDNSILYDFTSFDLKEESQNSISAAVTLVVSADQVERILQSIQQKAAHFFAAFHVEKDIAKISILGNSVNDSNIDVMNIACHTLQDHNIHIIMAHMLETRISILIPNSARSDALRFLHKNLGLDG